MGYRISRIIKRKRFKIDFFRVGNIGIFNLQDGTLTFINGGNEPPLFCGKGGAVTTLEPTGPVVGVIREAKFSVREISMERNDLLLAFTDGITDARNVEGVFFGNERLLELLNGGETTAAALVKNIEAHLCQFVGTANQFDDITLLVVKKDS